MLYLCLRVGGGVGAHEVQRERERERERVRERGREKGEEEGKKGESRNGGRRRILRCNYARLSSNIRRVCLN
jgi:hypothetical protein